MRKINLKYLLFPVFAILVSAYVAIYMNHASFAWKYLLPELMPDFVLRTLWACTVEIFRRYPLYAWMAYLFLFLSCVWWFARPRKISALAVCLASLLIGPSFYIVRLWVFAAIR
jgi:hypothetical protein